MTRRTALLSRLREERGTVLLLVAVSLVVFLLCAAFVVDIGNARQTARNYQNAADGAALAGAQGLPDSALLPVKPWDYAADYAFQTLLGVTRPVAGNCSDQLFFPAGEVPIPTGGAGTPNCYALAGLRVYVTTPWTDSPADTTPLPGGFETRQINVKICGRVATGFSRIVGISLIQPCRLATAMSAPGNGPCAVCVLNGPFEKSGNGSATITGSSAWINGNATSSGGMFSAPDGFYVEKTVTGFSPPYVEGAPRIVDPLKWLPTPMQVQPNWVDPYVPCTDSPCAGKFDFDPKNGVNQVVNPGIYTSIVVAKGDSSNAVTLLPGRYVITDRFEITSDVNVSAQGVTIYFACNGGYEPPNYQLCSPGSPPADGAYFRNIGGGTVTFSATSSPGDPYHNLLFFYDRNNQSTQSQLGGSFRGTIYALGAQFTLGDGNLNSLFVVDSMTLSGSGILNIIYNPDEQVPTYLPALIT